MKLLIFFIIIGAGLGLFLGCTSNKNLTKSYSETVQNFENSDTIWLNDWHVEDSSWLQLKSLPLKELVSLTDDPSGPVKFFALYFLLKKSYSIPEHQIDFFSILKERLYDQTPVVFKSQYTKPERVSIGECYLQLIRGCRFKSNILGTGYFFTESILLPKQSNLIDSLIICNKPFYNEESLDFILQITPDENIKLCIYDRILNEGIASFTNVLAKYNDPTDIPIILENLPIDSLPAFQTNRWMPFTFFQHPQFFEVLEQNWKAHWKDRNYVHNIAKYKTVEAAELLAEIYRNAKMDKKPFQYITKIGTQVENNYCNEYADLYLKIISENPENGNFYSWNHAAEIWEKFPNKMYKLYLDWKMKDSKNTQKRVEISFQYVTRFLEKNNPEQLVKEVMRFIKPESDFNYDNYLFRKKMPYFIYLNETKNYQMAAPLFRLFKEEKNGYVRFFLSKFLVKIYGDGLKKQITDFYYENPVLQPSLEDAKKGGAIFSDFLHYSEQK